MVFANRQQAALMLIPKLEQYRDRNPLVLAIPRGAVPMADAIVKSLGGDLDLLLSGKIAADANPELALGAVTENGYMHIEESALRMGYSRDEIEHFARRTIQKLQEKRQNYAPLVKPIDVDGRIVIVVDDGIATGATMTAAVESLRAVNPARIVVAAPVASTSAVSHLRGLADEVIVLDVPTVFYAVSQFYDDFSQVTDDDVIHVLSESRKQKPRRDAYQRGSAQAFDQIDPGV